MELRMTRSRSRTPFMVGEGEHEGSTVTRVTRSSTYYTNYDSGIHASEEEAANNTMRHRSSKTTKHSKKFITSDYSSEEGDNEVSSTDITTHQNHRNAQIERRQVNGSGLSALRFYREAKEYWNRYPKTDYTYSRHSKDRVEIAPGVVNMPNMSRRSIHEMCDVDVCNKETNTIESVFVENRQVNRAEKLKPRALFHKNNNVHHQRHEEEVHEFYRSTNVFIRIVSMFTSIFTVFYALLVTTFEKQNAWLVALGKMFHRNVSRIMMVDTWLLMGHGNGRISKSNALLGLCLIPLLLLGVAGLWWVTSLGGLVPWAWFNSTALSIGGFFPALTGGSSASEQYIVSSGGGASGVVSTGGAGGAVLEKIVKIQLDEPRHPGFSNEQLQMIAESLKAKLGLDLGTGEIVKIMLGDPSIREVEFLQPAVTAYKQSEIDYEKIIDGVINSERFKLGDKNNEEVERLRLEIDDLRKNLAAVLGQQTASHVLLRREVKTCCRKSFLQMEKYVSAILSTLLEKPHYKDQMLGWMNSIFVAKDDLEARINNATSKLKAEYDGLIQSNTKKLMDEVSLRLKRDIQYDVDLPADDHIKRIVRNILATYDADKTGLVDYALESAGGQIISTRCTESYKTNTAVVSILGVPIWYPSHSPRIVISPGIVPGECWSFQNFPGYLLIRLSMNVTIDAFSYEHINAKLTPSGRADSAPRNFSVHGFAHENDQEPSLIGQYIYDNYGEPLQFFKAQKENATYDLIELRVHSNNGNPQFTCLYRFRVHGKPS